MKIQKRSLLGCISAVFMIILIMDAKTSVQGAVNGIELCIKTVIPSLFPFFFLSGFIGSSIMGYSGKLLRPIGRICGIPSGAEPLLLLGLTGGYPVGAQAVNTAFEAGCIRRQDAQRMLGFCSSAGPAFIFGMAGELFENKVAPWALWAILILSSLITGMLLPGKSSEICNISSHTNKKPLEQAIKAMAAVCGWVVLFRVLLAFLNRWFLWLMPQDLSILFAGFLELTNGCIELYRSASPAYRFIALSAMLSFGGMCVGLQTVSVTGALSCKTYFIGKLLQTLIALLFSLFSSMLLFPGNV